MGSSQRFTTALLLHFIIVGIASAPGATASDPSGDWVVASDVYSEGERLAVGGDLLIQDGATLTLRGATLSIGGRVIIEAGGTLDVGPHGAAPSRILPTEGNDAFWMKVQGRIVTSGTPATEIRGLAGNGLATAMGGDGGLYIGGDADLSHVTIRDGMGPVVIGEGATAVVSNASVFDLGEVGIAALGTLDLRDSRIGGVDMGVTGRDTCDVSMNRVRINATGTHVAFNSCMFTLVESQLVRGQSAVLATGSADATIRDTVVARYNAEGLGATMHPGDDGVLKRPTIRVENTTFAPNPSANNGIFNFGGSLTGRDLIIVGHSGHGIDARSGTLDIQRSVMRLNGGFGINALGGSFISDPLASNDFGAVGSGQTNGEGEVAHKVVVNAMAVDASGQAVPELSIDVADADGVTRFSGRSSEEYLQIHFDAYLVGPDGRSAYAGPFTYRASHPALDGTRSGELPINGEPLEIHMAPSGGLPITAILVTVFLIAGVGLAGYALVGDRAAKILRRR